MRCPRRGRTRSRRRRGQAGEQLHRDAGTPEGLAGQRGGVGGDPGAGLFAQTPHVDRPQVERRPGQGLLEVGQSVAELHGQPGRLPRHRVGDEGHDPAERQEGEQQRQEDRNTARYGAPEQVDDRTQERGRSPDPRRRRRPRRRASRARRRRGRRRRPPPRGARRSRLSRAARSRPRRPVRAEAVAGREPAPTAVTGPARARRAAPRARRPPARRRTGPRPCPWGPPSVSMAGGARSTVPLPAIVPHRAPARGPFGRPFRGHGPWPARPPAVGDPSSAPCCAPDLHGSGGPRHGPPVHPRG